VNNFLPKSGEKWGKVSYFAKYSLLLHGESYFICLFDVVNGIYFPLKKVSWPVL